MSIAMAIITLIVGYFAIGIVLTLISRIILGWFDISEYNDLYDIFGVCMCPLWPVLAPLGLLFTIIAGATILANKVSDIVLKNDEFEFTWFKRK